MYCTSHRHLISQPHLPISLEHCVVVEWICGPLYNSATGVTVIGQPTRESGLAGCVTYAHDWLAGDLGPCHFFNWRMLPPFLSSDIEDDGEFYNHVDCVLRVSYFNDYWIFDSFKASERGNQKEEKIRWSSELLDKFRRSCGLMNNRDRPPMPRQN